MTDNPTTSSAGPQAPALLDLNLDVEQTKAELALPEPEPRDELTARASEQVDRLLVVDPANQESRDAARAAVESMGRDLQQRAATRSKMLQAPMRDLAQASEDGGPVAKSLADLRMEVEKLDPSGLDTDAGWLTRTIGKIPGVGTPLKRYFMRYESSQTQIDAIIGSLERGRDQLKRDNVTLSDDQSNMRELTVSLADQIALAQALDQVLVERLATEMGPDDPRRQFVEEDILFTIRQRTLDLQQQLAVNQQGVLATELIIRNNRELIRGVDRALDVTVSALQVAVTVALALSHQKLVLDKIDAINTTTSEMIAGTAARLKTQGTEIHRQATGSMLDMDALRTAFEDIDIALEQISTYRKDALPMMAANIIELDQLTGDSEAAIERMEQGRAATDRLEPDGGPIDIGDVTPSGDDEGSR
ncbi:toxic anion resistance protein [Ilumatobacter sp.]|uniref:toxic anion resistance protein n=1 Tax=Ilumatobacter sp. TaxID=1967498 RepID=UPI003C32CC78